MIVCDDFIYIQLQKTGCSHIASLLCQLFDCEVKGQHNAATPEQLASAQYFISSIRNPWDWYISLWAYGAQGEGRLMHSLTMSTVPELSKLNFKLPLDMQGDKDKFQAQFDIYIKSVQAWRDVYGAGNSVDGFRSWLKLIHDPKNYQYLGEGYSETAITKQCGFMSYRYLRLCCRNLEKLEGTGLELSVSEVVQFDKANCYIDYFIRQEALEEQLCEALERVRSLTKEERGLILSGGKSNISNRQFSIADYYDRESIDLVQDRDRLIIEKFNYSPPS